MPLLVLVFGSSLVAHVLVTAFVLIHEDHLLHSIKLIRMNDITDYAVKSLRIVVMDNICNDTMCIR